MASRPWPPTGGPPTAFTTRSASLGVLREQPALFGEVASSPTAWRVIAAITPERLGALRDARRHARERAWAKGMTPERMTLDFDATLITAHSEKEGAAGNFKGGFGFHPLVCYLDESKEALAGILRPGNAGANTAADHVAVLHQAMAQLPEPGWGMEILARADSGHRSRFEVRTLSKSPSVPRRTARRRSSGESRGALKWAAGPGSSSRCVPAETVDDGDRRVRSARPRRRCDHVATTVCPSALLSWAASPSSNPASGARVARRRRPRPRAGGWRSPAPSRRRSR